MAVNVCSVAVLLSAIIVAAQARAYFDAIVVDAESRSDDGEELNRRRASPEDCLLPRATGHCRAFFQSYYFNKSTKRCELFVYSGCGGNNNRFESKDECERLCVHKNKEASEQLTKRCNRDVIPPACSRGCRLVKDANNCPKCDCSSHKNVCSLPPQRGHCRALLPRWRYDPAIGKCSEFKFGGCDGNGNNFRTEQQCMKVCGGV